LLIQNPGLLTNTTESTFVQSLFPGSYMLGNVFGPLFTPFIIFIIGFKFTILGFASLAIVAQIFSIFSFHYYMLCAFRFINGISTGVLTVAGTSYARFEKNNFETSSNVNPKIRGFIGSFFLVGGTSSLLFANVSGFFTLIPVYNWRIMIFFGLIPPSVLFLLGVFLPESPIWRQDKKEKKKMNLFPQLKKILFTWKVIWRMFLCKCWFSILQ
jgi:MFS family permease